MATSVKGVLVVVLAVALAQCNSPSPGTVIGPLLAPCPAGTPPSDAGQLHACVDSLAFDTIAAAGDEQRLLVRGGGPGAACHGADTSHTCRHGPLAKIEPVINAHLRDTMQLNEGRIIARLFLRPGESESYGKLGLEPAGMTYWWVKRTSASSATSRYITLAGNTVTMTNEQSITIEQHPPGAYGQALARFIWDEADEKTQGPCGVGCCR
jgi:hypothetical protein